jgi:molybdate transport system substrate-binding protein
MAFPSARSVLWLVGLAALSAGGCHRPSSGAGDMAPAKGPPLRIAAASDLQHVLPRLAQRFQEQTQTNTTLTLDASGRLAEQIKAGAPFDVFMAANERFVRDLADAALIDPGSVETYARGTLVICVHRSVTVTIHTLADLAKPEITKIAIANPEYAPYGVAARQALERAGLWARLEPKIVRAPSVRQALIYARNGDADAALVSRAQAGDAEVLTVDIDASLYDPLIQAMGIVAATGQRDRANEFVRFVMSPAGQQILQEGGFEKPVSPGPATTTPARSAAAP